MPSLSYNFLRKHLPVYVYITFCFCIFLAGYTNIILEKKKKKTAMVGVRKSFLLLLRKKANC